MTDHKPPDGRRGHSRWLTTLARRAPASLITAVAAPLLSGCLLVVQAWLLASLIEAAVVGKAALADLTGLFLILAGIMAARGALSFAGDSVGARAAEQVQTALRSALFQYLLARRPAWSAARPSGALATAIVDQPSALEGFIARYLPSMVAAALLPLSFAAVVMAIEPVAGLLLLVTAPLIPLFMMLTGWGAEAASRAQQQTLARLSGFFADRLRGLLTLKLFGRIEAEARSMRAAADEWRKRTMQVLRIAFLSSAVLEFFAALGVAGVALYVGLTYLGFLDLHRGTLDLKTGLFCLLMAPEVYFPLRQLAAHYHDRAAAVASVAQIEDAFGELPLAAASTKPGATRRVAPNAGAIAIACRDLTVRTPDDGRIVLDHAHMQIRTGAHVAIVGESGCGKSTLLEAIAGLRDYDGAITLQGQPLEQIASASLRLQVAMISQRPHVFHGAIADNIRLGGIDASDEDVKRAAELAGVQAFAAPLTNGLHTIVGEGGLGLSGGEAHRVALARLFLRDPGLILLDEPTAHLDPDTEQRVFDSILAFARGRTLVIATHSRAIIERMDHVFVIADRKLRPMSFGSRAKSQPVLESAA